MIVFADEAHLSKIFTRTRFPLFLVFCVTFIFVCRGTHVHVALGWTSRLLEKNKFRVLMVIVIVLYVC